MGCQQQKQPDREEPKRHDDKWSYCQSRWRAHRTSCQMIITFCLKNSRQSSLRKFKNKMSGETQAPDQCKNTTTTLLVGISIHCGQIKASSLILIKIRWAHNLTCRGKELCKSTHWFCSGFPIKARTKNQWKLSDPKVL